MRIMSQSIIVVPPCCAYPKISIPWIKVETPMIWAIPCEYYIYCCRFVDGGVSMNDTFKPRHTSIHWILSWGIEVLVYFEDEMASRLTYWLVSVEIYNNSYKTLHAHNWNEEMWVYQNKVVEHIVKMGIEKATLILHTHVTHGIDDLDEIGACMHGTKPTTFKYDIQGPTSFHQICLLHMWMGVAWKFVQTSSCPSSYMYQSHQKKIHLIFVGHDMDLIMEVLLSYL